jgi:hypothetical protein
MLKSRVETGRAPRSKSPAFYCENGRCYADCGSGVLRVLAFELDGQPMSAEEFVARFGIAPVALDD